MIPFPLAFTVYELLINAYVKAVGGLERINDIKNMMIVMEASIQGMTLKIKSAQPVIRRIGVLLKTSFSGTGFFCFLYME
jgi:hypothetical protein